MRALQGNTDECVHHRGTSDEGERYKEDRSEDKRFHSATKYANKSQWRRTRQLCPEQCQSKEGCCRWFSR